MTRKAIFDRQKRHYGVVLLWNFILFLSWMLREMSTSLPDNFSKKNYPGRAGGEDECGHTQPGWAIVFAQNQYKIGNMIKSLLKLLARN